MYPFAIIAVGMAVYYANAAKPQPRPAVIVAAVLWLLYAGYEVLIAKAILCDEKCNIRVDLILIWPILMVASLFASKTPGKWSPRSIVFGLVSLGSLALAVILFALVYLESKDIFFPARRECKAGGETAVQACDEALRQAPGDFTLYYHRALAYRATGDRDRAISNMSKALESYQNYAEAHIGRGVLQYENNDIGNALSDFDAAVKLNPLDAVAPFWRGTAYARNGELARAAADLTQSIELEAKHGIDPENRFAPTKADIFDGRGVVNLQVGSFERAITDFDAALELNPYKASSLYGRGLAKIRLGDTAGGEADTAAARAINSEVAATYAKLGLN